jgi:hypothetical protein
METIHRQTATTATIRRMALKGNERKVVSDKVCPVRSAAGEARQGNEVADFLRSAVPLVNAEPRTISWFAIQGAVPFRYIRYV